MTDPTLAQDSDIDADSVPDSTDNCISVANTDQTNHDGDRYGDACDIDDDNDGLIDHFDTAPFDANSPTTAPERLVITKRRIIGFGQDEDMAFGTSLDIASGKLVIGAPFSTNRGELNIFEQTESGNYELKEKLAGDIHSRILGIDVDVTTTVVLCSALTATALRTPLRAEDYSHTLILRATGRSTAAPSLVKPPILLCNECAAQQMAHAW